MKTVAAICLVMMTIGLAAPVRADAPEIVKVSASKPGIGWEFQVTLRHPDTGWDHYADGWEVLDVDGNRLGYRKLHHPHVDEQPFTRSLRRVMVPDGTRKVLIRARCNEHGWASNVVEVELSPDGRASY